MRAHSDDSTRASDSDGDSQKTDRGRRPPGAVDHIAASDKVTSAVDVAELELHAAQLKLAAIRAEAAAQQTRKGVGPAKPPIEAVLAKPDAIKMDTSISGGDIHKSESLKQSVPRLSKKQATALAPGLITHPRHGNSSSAPDENVGQSCTTPLSHASSPRELSKPRWPGLVTGSDTKPISDKDQGDASTPLSLVMALNLDAPDWCREGGLNSIQVSLNQTS
jgi:hypothetical protein